MSSSSPYFIHFISACAVLVILLILALLLMRHVRVLRKGYNNLVDKLAAAEDLHLQLLSMADRQKPAAQCGIEANEEPYQDPFEQSVAVEQTSTENVYSVPEDPYSIPDCPTTEHMQLLVGTVTVADHGHNVPSQQTGELPVEVYEQNGDDTYSAPFFPTPTVLLQEDIDRTDTVDMQPLQASTTAKKGESNSKTSSLAVYRRPTPRSNRSSSESSRQVVSSASGADPLSDNEQETAPEIPLKMLTDDDMP